MVGRAAAHGPARPVVHDRRPVAFRFVVRLSALLGAFTFVLAACGTSADGQTIDGWKIGSPEVRCQLALDGNTQIGRASCRERV